MKFPALIDSRRNVVALALIALAVRLIFVFAYGATARPVTWGDDETYDGIARQLATYHTYGNTWYPPGYPLFLALIYALFGHALILVRVAQAILGAGTCVLTYVLGKRVFSHRVGLCAGVLLALYPGHVYISWRILSETLYIILLVAGTAIAVQAAKTPRAMSIAALGLVMGFANVVKSNLFLLPPLLAVWLAFALRGRWQARARYVGIFCATFVCIALLTPVFNAIASGRERALLPGNAGHTLWWANNPTANGYYNYAEREPEGQTFILRHGFAGGLQHASDFEKDRMYGRLAILWIRENPRKFSGLCLAKLNNAFGLFPHAVTFEGGWLVRVVHLLSYGVMAPFAFAGMIAGLRSWRNDSLLYVVVSSYVPMVVIFYGTPRFTIMIVPYLILFASYALIAVIDYLSGKHLHPNARKEKVSSPAQAQYYVCR